MSPSFQCASHALTPIAATGERFSDFAPYVAAINNSGLVSFQAALHDGGSGVYAGDGGSIATIVDSASSPFREICSHPDITSDGSCCFYATFKSGGRGVFLVRSGEIITVSGTGGPLGPTMSEAGRVAFRAEDDPERGGAGGGIFTGSGSAMTMIAEIADRFGAFHGLPVINAAGTVAFCADLKMGGQGIYIGEGTRAAPIVETGEQFNTLGSFPAINDAGTVAFCGTLRDGRSGIFAASDGRITTILDSSGPFESFRGVNLNNAGRVVFYATPRGGTLGVFSGPDPRRNGVLAMGSPLFGSTISEFALNPVSINDVGQMAIRVRLADHRQFILRADICEDESRTRI